MCLSDVKSFLLINLHIMRSRESMQNDTITFEQKWEIFDFLRTDSSTKHSWYTIMKYLFEQI